MKVFSASPMLSNDGTYEQIFNELKDFYIDRLDQGPLWTWWDEIEDFYEAHKDHPYVRTALKKWFSVDGVADYLYETDYSEYYDVDYERDIPFDKWFKWYGNKLRLCGRNGYEYLCSLLAVPHYAKRLGDFEYAFLCYKDEAGQYYHICGRQNGKFMNIEDSVILDTLD